MYLRTLSNRVTGYANVKTSQFLVHLYATYGCLSPSDLIATDTKMKSGYDPNLPIESFIDQIKDGIVLADAAAPPYSSAQIIAIAYNVHFSTGIFPDAYHDWQRYTLLQQTWATFKVNFALAHQELRNSQVTSNQACYQAANNTAYDTASCNIQQETALAIANPRHCHCLRQIHHCQPHCHYQQRQRQIYAGQCQTCSCHRQARFLENCHGISCHRFCANVYPQAQAQVNWCSSCPQHQLLLDSWLSCQQHPHRCYLSPPQQRTPDGSHSLQHHGRIHPNQGRLTGTE
jgi:hypothetical protein